MSSSLEDGESRSEMVGVWVKVTARRVDKGMVEATIMCDGDDCENFFMREGEFYYEVDVGSGCILLCAECKADLRVIGSEAKLVK